MNFPSGFSAALNNILSLSMAESIIFFIVIILIFLSNGGLPTISLAIFPNSKNAFQGRRCSSINPDLDDGSVDEMLCVSG